MKMWQTLASGLAGAAALTLVHEIARRNIDEAPRMDQLGMEAIAEGMEAVGHAPPSRDTLFNAAMLGDLVSNSLYYSLVGAGGNGGSLGRGLLLGLAAGVGGVVLPEHLGLSPAPSSRTKATQAMTIGWYTLGGVVAGAVYRLLDEDSSSELPTPQA